MSLIYSLTLSMMNAQVSCASWFTLLVSDSRVNSGEFGSSYGSSIPVNPFILPSLAILYKPLGSLPSHVSNEAFTYISMKETPVSSAILRTTFLSARYGETNATRVTIPLSAISLLTCPTRRMFSVRSSAENPRSWQRPCLCGVWEIRDKYIFCERLFCDD
jgi:hypothetical protein